MTVALTVSRSSTNGVDVDVALEHAVLLGQLDERGHGVAVDLGAPRRQRHLLGGRLRRLGVGRDDPADLVRVLLREVERLVHRAREALDDVRVLLRVLLGREVLGDRQVGRELLERLGELGRAGRERRADERLDGERRVDALGLQRRRDVRERDLDELHLGDVDARLLQASCAPRPRAGS